MKTLLLGLALATSVAATSPSVSSSVSSFGPSIAGQGDKIPSTKLDVHQSMAGSLEEFQGRALLVEFFAHW